MTKANSIHPADNFMMTQWVRMPNTNMFNQTPFGVYAFTEPTDILPSKKLLPHMFEKTIYIGKSGNSYDDYVWDRKHFDEETNKERFHRYSVVERRLKTHRHNLTNTNSSIDRETSYQKFYDAFGYGPDVIKNVNVCVIVPKMAIPNYMVPSWCMFMESYLIYLYQQKFGKNTLMNVLHSETKKVEDSLSNGKRQQVLNCNLSEYFQ